MRFARLDVLVVRADIANVGEGEGDDLAGVGGIGEDLLVAGHRRVEAQLANRLALRSEPFAPHGPSVGEHHDSRRALRLGRRRGSRIGQEGLPRMKFRRCR